MVCNGMIIFETRCKSIMTWIRMGGGKSLFLSYNRTTMDEGSGTKGIG